MAKVLANEIAITRYREAPRSVARAELEPRFAYQVSRTFLSTRMPMKQSLGKTMFSTPMSSAEMYDRLLARLTEGNAPTSVTGDRRSTGRLEAKADEVTARARAITEEEAATRLAKTEALMAARLNAPGSAPSPKVKAKQLADPSKAKARG